MEQILTDVLKLVIMAAVAFAVYMIRNELVPLIRSKMTAEQLQTAQKFADMFVYMAQQVFGGLSARRAKSNRYGSVEKRADRGKYFFNGQADRRHDRSSGQGTSDRGIVRGNYSKHRDHNRKDRGRVIWQHRHNRRHLLSRSRR